MTVTPESPLVLRLAAWADERFPLSHGVLFLVLYLTALLLGRAGSSQEALNLCLGDLVGFVGVYAFFLMHGTTSAPVIFLTCSRLNPMLSRLTSTHEL